MYFIIVYEGIKVDRDVNMARVTSQKVTVTSSDVGSVLRYDSYSSAAWYCTAIVEGELILARPRQLLL